MTSTSVAPRTSADHSTRQPFPEVPCSPPGSAAPTPQTPRRVIGFARAAGLRPGDRDQPVRVAIPVAERPASRRPPGRTRQRPGQPIPDPGVDEQLHDRFCPTCGVDEIAASDIEVGDISSGGHRMGERL